MVTVDELERLREEALRELEGLDTEEALQAWYAGYLGRRSRLMEAFAALGTLPRELRPAIGRKANEVKEALEAAYAARREALRQAALRRELEAPPLDVTLPGRRSAPAGFTRPPAPSGRSSPSSPRWASRSSPAGTWRPMNTTSSCSTSHPITLPGICGARSTPTGRE